MQPEELVRRIFEVTDAGDYDAIDELFADDYVDHSAIGDITGREAFKDYIRMFRAALSDVHTEVRDFFTDADGELAAWNVRVTATHTGELNGIPATGKRIDIVSQNIGRVRDGRAVEHWSEGGMLQLLTQIGALPAPAVPA
jgi:steroid delta-isomerase-like uncharacterized protein